MTDTPAHGPDSSTPPNGSGSGKSKKKRKSGKRQRSRRKPDTVATPTETPTADRKGGRKRSTAKKGPSGRRITPRGTAADVEAMVALVFDRIVLGDRRRDILRYVAKAHADNALKWLPSPRTMDDYIAKATERLRELSNVDRSTALAEARGRFQLIIRKAHDAGDLGTVRLATRDLARIDGLEPVHVRHSGSVINEHTGTVSHEVEHTARPATLEEQAGAIRTLFGVATARRAGLGTPAAPAAGNPSNN